MPAKQKKNLTKLLNDLFKTTQKLFQEMLKKLFKDSSKKISRSAIALRQLRDKFKRLLKSNNTSNLILYNFNQTKFNFTGLGTANLQLFFKQIPKGKNSEIPL